MSEPEAPGPNDESVLFTPDDGEREPGAPPEPAATAEDGGRKRAKAPKEKKPLLWRTAILYHKLHLPPVRSRRGIAIIVLLIAGVGAMVTMVGLKAAGYSESASFCSKCHQMGPEMRAYQASAHSELPCADCHVSPGVTGWIKAKAKGTQQLFQVITHTFPQPIPPPDHSELPPVKYTCLKCHALSQITKDGGPIQVVLRPQYLTDAANTQTMIAVVVRPQGLGNAAEAATEANGNPRGVHWHVQLKVTYLSTDPKTQTIDSVTVANADGTSSTYVAANQVTMSGNVAPDLKRLNATETSHTMDCLDCHNRAGHGTPTPSQAVDSAISTGKISQAIPYIKKNAVDQLNKDYQSLAEADAGIDTLQSWYAKNYPNFTKGNQASISAALAYVKVIYAALATPEMKVYADTYPNNLGHQSSPGCFRCHDGAHFLVQDGKVTGETIPSTCSTCHTFPQTGTNVTDINLGSAPASHNDPLWVFDHKNAAAAVAAAQNAALQGLPGGSVQPSGTTCGTCHQRDYCETCHKTGASTVSHQAMLFNHAAVIRELGGTRACATCHQPVQCEVCHKGNMLQGYKPGSVLFNQ